MSLKSLQERKTGGECDFFFFLPREWIVTSGLFGKDVIFKVLKLGYVKCFTGKTDYKINIC